MPIEALKVDLTGITVKSFREIRESIASEVTGLFNGIDLSPSTPDGQLVDLFAYAYMEVVQGIQAIISNIDVNTAQGAWLDKLASIAGVQRNGMTDEELRKLIKQASFEGLATVPGMLTYLRNALGTVGVSVSEDVDRHEVHVIIYDESIPENDIADAIFYCKPAGIRTTGSVNAKTSEGYEVRFDYLQQGNLSLKVHLTRYDEEVLPDDYEITIRHALVKYVSDNFGNGKDIIVKRLYSPIFGSVDGIENISIEASFEGKTTVDGVIPVYDGMQVVLSEDGVEIEVVE